MKENYGTGTVTFTGNVGTVAHVESEYDRSLTGTLTFSSGNSISGNIAAGTTARSLSAAPDTLTFGFNSQIDHKDPHISTGTINIGSNYNMAKKATSGSSFEDRPMPPFTATFSTVIITPKFYDGPVISFNSHSHSQCFAGNSFFIQAEILDCNDIITEKDTCCLSPCNFWVRNECCVGDEEFNNSTVILTGTNILSHSY